MSDYPIGEYPDCSLLRLPAPPVAGRGGDVDPVGAVSVPVPPISEVEHLRAQLSRFGLIYGELLGEHARVLAERDKAVAERREFEAKYYTLESRGTL